MNHGYTEKMNRLLDRLLERECYIIDFLPKQVHRDSRGQFFEVENYLLNTHARYGLNNKYISIILKIMCYYPVSIQWGKWIEQPKPEQVVEIIDAIMENHSGDVDILLPDQDVLLQFGWDCLNMSIYNPNEEMCEILEKIAISEGMFWRKSI